MRGPWLPPALATALAVAASLSGCILGPPGPEPVYAQDCTFYEVAAVVPADMVADYVPDGYAPLDPTGQGSAAVLSIVTRCADRGEPFMEWFQLVPVTAPTDVEPDEGEAVVLVAAASSDPGRVQAYEALGLDVSWATLDATVDEDPVVASSWRVSGQSEAGSLEQLIVHDQSTWRFPPISFLRVIVRGEPVADAILSQGERVVEGAGVFSASGSFAPITGMGMGAGFVQSAGNLTVHAYEVPT